MSKLSDMLVYLRKRENISQGELARRLGLTRSRISMFELGQREPSLEILELFADYYNVDMNTLTGQSANEDENLNSLLQALHDTPGLRMMFDVSKTRSNEDVLQAVEIIKAFYRTKDGEQ